MSSLTAALLLCSALAIAGPGRHGRHGERRLRHLVERLDLTADQEKQVRQVIAENREQRTDRRQELAAAREALTDLMHAETIDEPAIRAAHARLSALKADAVIARARMMHEVRALLTSEQQAEARKMIDGLRAWRGKRGGDQQLGGSEVDE